MSSGRGGARPVQHDDETAPRGAWLADCRAGFFVFLIARRHGKEELTLRIPELRLNLLLESGSLLAIFGCLFLVAG